MPYVPEDWKHLEDHYNAAKHHLDLLALGTAGMAMKWKEEGLPEDPEPDAGPVEPVVEVPPEPAPFGEGGEYWWLPDSYDLTELDMPSWVDELAQADHNGVAQCDHPGLQALPYSRHTHSGGFQSSHVVVLGDDVSNAFDRGMSAEGPSGDHGPLWYHRYYNVEGSASDICVWRVGDFHKGREGHVIYGNVVGDLSLDRVLGIQHGAQLFQFVWRPEETLLPESEWPDSNDRTLSLTQTCSIDGGVINGGQAVRASWPYSIFLPGHRSIVIDRAVVRCNHGKPFWDKNVGWCRSHGFLLASPPKGSDVGAEHLLVRGIDVRLCRPDRSVSRVASIEEVEFESGILRVHDEGGAWMPSKITVSDVAKLTIEADFGWSGTVQVHRKDEPYKSPVAKFEHVAGERLVLHPRELAGEA